MREPTFSERLDRIEIALDAAYSVIGDVRADLIALRDQAEQFWAGQEVR